MRGRQPERIQRVNAETTERVDVPSTRRVRTCLSLSVCNKSPESSRANPVRFLPSYERCYTGVRNPGRKSERRCHHVLTDGFAICGCHPVARGTPPGTRKSAAGHEGGPGEAILCPRPEPAGGPRACYEPSRSHISWVLVFLCLFCRMELGWVTSLWLRTYTCVGADAGRFKQLPSVAMGARLPSSCCFCLVLLI